MVGRIYRKNDHRRRDQASTYFKIYSPDFKFNAEGDGVKSPSIPTQPADGGELIINYFKSEDFMKIKNEEK